MKILLKGYYGFGNLGDDILLKVTYGLVKNKFPDSEIFVFSNHTPNLKGFTQKADYNHYIFQILGEKVGLIDWTRKGHFDLIIHGGGGTYFDYQNGGPHLYIFNKLLLFFGAGFAYRLEKILRLLTLKSARITCGKRVGIGLGIDRFHPAAPGLFRKLAEIGSYDRLMVRDPLSRMYLKNFGYRKPAFTGTDLAFFTQHWKQDSDQKENNVIGIVLMDLPDNTEALLKSSSILSEILREKGFALKLFSFYEAHDLKLIECFREEGLIIWQPNLNQHEDFYAEFSECSLIISTRAHGAILGACFGAIPLCLHVSEKLKQITNMFPASSMLIDLPFDPKNIANLVEEIFNNLDQYREKLAGDLRLNEDVSQEFVTWFEE